MNRLRRIFLKQSTVAMLTTAVAPGSIFARASRPLDILILGGTGFIGPHEINYALARGHKVTMFNRGKTAPDMFPDIERLIGDRSGDLDSLKGRNWDVVIDNSGFYPRHVRLSAEFLYGHVEYYIFVSSISVYNFNLDKGRRLQPSDDEYSAPIATMDDPVSEKDSPYGPTYGARKALCEMEVRRVFGKKAINVRPGVITGPGDPTERIRHWLVRFLKGNEVLIPGTPDDPVQVIDARDLCSWMIRLAERGGSGPYNAVGPDQPYHSREFFQRIRSVTGSESVLTWVNRQWLNQVEPELPSYNPLAPPAFQAFMQVDNKRALATDLAFRPIEETVKDMMVLLENRQRSKLDFGGGLSLEREAELLKLWHERQR